jgi:hypothetical protein
VSQVYHNTGEQPKSRESIFGFYATVNTCLPLSTSFIKAREVWAKTGLEKAYTVHTSVYTQTTQPWTAWRNPTTGNCKDTCQSICLPDSKGNCLICSLVFKVWFVGLIPTTGLVPISYRVALLSTLLHASLIPTSHNRPSAYQLQRSAMSTLLHVSLIPTSHNRPSTYQLHKSATEHSSTCKSHSHKPRQA